MRLVDRTWVGWQVQYLTSGAGAEVWRSAARLLPRGERDSMIPRSEQLVVGSRMASVAVKRSVAQKGLRTMEARFPEKTFRVERVEYGALAL